MQKSSSEAAAWKKKTNLQLLIPSFLKIICDNNRFEALYT